MTAEKPPETPAAPAEPKPLPLWQQLLEKPMVAAPIVLVGLLIWPTWDLVMALRKGGPVTLPVLMYILFPVAAAGIWFKIRASYVVAQYVAGIGAAWFLIQAVLLKVQPAFLPGAALTALFFWLGNKHDPTAPKKEAGSDGEQTIAWVRENAEAIAVAFMMALIIRCFCIEVFQIPTSSMVPTLMGNDENGRQGDRIMVTKYYYSFTPIERFDIVVFKFPLNLSKNYIKRVVGLPDEWLFVHYGNIWTSHDGLAEKEAPPRDPFRIARRPLRVQQAIWIDLMELKDHWNGDMSVLRNPETFDAEFTPVPGDRGHAGHEVVDHRLRTIAKDGVRYSRFRFPGAEHLNDQWELRLALDVEIDDPAGTFDLRIGNDFGTFTLKLKAAEAGDLVWNGSENLKTPLKSGAFGSGVRRRVELLVYDGLATALVDGREAAGIEFFGDYGRCKTLARHASGTEVWFGSEDTTYSAWNIAVGRDVHYAGKTNIEEGPQRPLKIGPDQFVMMGDNVGSSHDSRLWKHHVFTKTDGTKLECESLELKDSGSETQKWAADNGYKDEIDFLVTADKRGMPRPLRKRDLVKTPDGEWHTNDPYPFVPRENIVGKALWIWWPPGRWGRLIK